MLAGLSGMVAHAVNASIGKQAMTRQIIEIPPSIESQLDARLTFDGSESMGFKAPLLHPKLQAIRSMAWNKAVVLKTGASPLAPMPCSSALMHQRRKSTDFPSSPYEENPARSR
ncbi:hypothetical protein [Dyella sp. C11]|uniref:hypothetical protein n=1 Tax=Dyella sp. C11 TaxID=2126991 RepID=UPI001E40833E|nr:hypothetical protein [Dyella sp. C11]